MRNGAISALLLNLLREVAGYCLRVGRLSADQRDVLSQCANLICRMISVSFDTITKRQKPLPISLLH